MIEYLGHKFDSLKQADVHHSPGELFFSWVTCSNCGAYYKKFSDWKVTKKSEIKILEKELLESMKEHWFDKTRTCENTLINNVL